MRTRWIVTSLGCAAALGGALWLTAGPTATAPPPAPVASTAPAPTGLRPPPTEHWLDEDAEKDNKKQRKDWFKRRHRAAPDVDWRAVERQNGLAQITKRNALADTEPPPGAPRWQERGSDNQAGRMHVARHSTDGTKLYGGSSLGGIWRGDLEGGNWEPLGDNLYGGAHWLEVFPGEDGGPDIILAGTDNGLLHRSTDDGASWSVPTGLPITTQIRRLIKTYDGSHTTFLVIGDIYGAYGLYRSEDAGASFSEVYSLTNKAGDVWIPRDGDTTLYVMHGHELLVSEDLGDSFQSVSTVSKGADRAEITGSEAGAPTLWVVLDGTRVFVSVDAGETWAGRGGAPDYWGSLGASPNDPELFAYAGVEMFKTHDNGDSFELQNEWWAYYDDPANLLHADVPGLDVVLTEDGGEIWYIATDGGLYRSVDQLETVENLGLTGLRVSQYYTTHTSIRDSSHVAAGSQDQGYQVGATMKQTDEVYDFEQIISGDYAHLTSSDGTHDLVYSVYPGFILVQIGEENPQLSYVDFPQIDAYFAWLPPVVADPTDPEAFFFCADKLYRYTRSDYWNWSSQQWSDENFAVSSYEFLSAVAFANDGTDGAWAATSYGRLLWSEDRGVTWTESEDRGPDSHWFYGTALHVSQTEPDVIYAGGSGYSVPAVYRSVDRGRSWQPYASGLPDTLVYALVEAPDGSGTLFAGTESAAYHRDADGAAWEDITGADAPVTIYWSAEALHDENTIRFGTYGRGIWDYQLDPDGLGCFPVVDHDKDGVPCDEDCDDFDPTIFPGNEDACDGVDVNCDPLDPEEQDDDGDGAWACDDCDDSDADVHPGAEEICGDGIDNDCSGGDAPCEEDEVDDDTAVELQGACGCATPSPAGLVWLPAIAVLVRRRR